MASKTVRNRLAALDGDSSEDVSENDDSEGSCSESTDGEEDSNDQNEDDSENLNEDDSDEYFTDEVQNEVVQSASSDDNSEKESCPICLNRFIGQDLGVPENCDHIFCLECITEWSKNINTCPIDRTEFNRIHLKSKPSGKTLKKIKVKVQKKEPEATLQEEVTLCEVCRLGDREHRLLLCDACDLAYHCDCLDPPLFHVPIQEWFCPPCSGVMQNAPTAGPSGYQSRRIIPRTTASEAVRTRVQRLRDNITSSKVPSITRPKTQTPQKRKRHTYRRRKCYKKVVQLARTKQDMSGGGKGKAGSRTTKVIVTSYRRRRRRRKRKVGTTRSRSTRTGKTVSAKNRIAGVLGICKPNKGVSIPDVKHKAGSSSSVDKLPSCAIFGRRDQLMDFSENFNEDLPSTSSASSSSSNQRNVPQASTSSSNLLDSILAGQKLLHSKSNNLIIRTDGSLAMKDGKKKNSVVVKKATEVVKPVTEGRRKSVVRMGLSKYEAVPKQPSKGAGSKSSAPASINKKGSSSTDGSNSNCRIPQESRSGSSSVQNPGSSGNSLLPPTSHLRLRLSQNRSSKSETDQKSPNSETSNTFSLKEERKHHSSIFGDSSTSLGNNRHSNQNLVQESTLNSKANISFCLREERKHHSSIFGDTTNPPGYNGRSKADSNKPKSNFSRSSSTEDDCTILQSKSFVRKGRFSRSSDLENVSNTEHSIKVEADDNSSCTKRNRAVNLSGINSTSIKVESMFTEIEIEQMHRNGILSEEEGDFEHSQSLIETPNVGCSSNTRAANVESSRIKVKVEPIAFTDKNWNSSNNVIELDNGSSNEESQSLLCSSNDLSVSSRKINTGKFRRIKEEPLSSDDDFVQIVEVKNRNKRTNSRKFQRIKIESESSDDSVQIWEEAKSNRSNRSRKYQSVKDEPLSTDEESAHNRNIDDALQDEDTMEFHESQSLIESTCRETESLSVASSKNNQNSVENPPFIKEEQTSPHRTNDPSKQISSETAPVECSAQDVTLNVTVLSKRHQTVKKENPSSDEEPDRCIRRNFNASTHDSTLKSNFSSQWRKELPATQLAKQPNQRKDLPSTQLAGPSSLQMDDLPLTQVAGPSSLQMDDLPLTQVAGPPSLQMDDLPLTQVAGPSSLQMDDLPLTQVAGPPSLQMDDLPLTQVAEPPSLQKDDLPLTQVAGPSSLQKDDLPLTQVAGPSSLQKDDLPLTQVAGPPSLQMDDLPSTQLVNQSPCFAKPMPLSSVQIDALPCTQLANQSFDDFVEPLPFTQLAGISSKDMDDLPSTQLENNPPNHFTKPLSSTLFSKPYSRCLEKSSDFAESLPPTQVAAPSLQTDDLPCTQLANQPFNEFIETLSSTRVENESSNSGGGLASTQLANEPRNQFAKPLPFSRLSRTSSSHSTDLSSRPVNPIIRNQVASSSFQVDDLPCTQLAGLPCTQVDDLPCAQVAGLPCTQVDDLPCTQLAGLPCTQVGDLPCTQVAGLPCTQVDDLPCTQLVGLPCTQVDDLPCTQLADLPSHRDSYASWMDELPATQLEPSRLATDLRPTELFNNGSTVVDLAMENIPSSQLAEPSLSQSDLLPSTQLVKSFLNKGDDLQSTQLAARLPSVRSGKSANRTGSSVKIGAASVFQVTKNIPAMQFSTKSPSDEMSEELFPSQLADDLPATQADNPVSNRFEKSAKRKSSAIKTGETSVFQATKNIPAMQFSRKSPSDELCPTQLADDLPATQADNPFSNPFENSAKRKGPSIKTGKPSVFQATKNVPAMLFSTKSPSDETSLELWPTHLADELPATQANDSTVSKKCSTENALSTDLPETQPLNVSTSSSCSNTKTSVQVLNLLRENRDLPATQLCDEEGIPPTQLHVNNDLPATQLAPESNEPIDHVSNFAIGSDEGTAKNTESSTRSLNPNPETESDNPSTNNCHVDLLNAESNQSGGDSDLPATQAVLSDDGESLPQENLPEEKDKDTFIGKGREFYDRLLKENQARKENSLVKKVCVHKNLPQVLTSVPTRGVLVPKPSNRKTFSFEQVKEKLGLKDDNSCERNRLFDVRRVSENIRKNVPDVELLSCISDSLPPTQPVLNFVSNQELKMQDTATKFDLTKVKTEDFNLVNGLLPSMIIDKTSIGTTKVIKEEPSQIPCDSSVVLNGCLKTESVELEVKIKDEPLSSEDELDVSTGENVLSTKNRESARSSQTHDKHLTRSELKIPSIRNRIKDEMTSNCKVEVFDLSSCKETVDNEAKKNRSKLLEKARKASVSEKCDKRRSEESLNVFHGSIEKENKGNHPQSDKHNRKQTNNCAEEHVTKASKDKYCDMSSKDRGKRDSSSEKHSNGKSDVSKRHKSESAEKHIRKDIKDKHNDEKSVSNRERKDKSTSSRSSKDERKSSSNRDIERQSNTTRDKHNEKGSNNSDSRRHQKNKSPVERDCKNDHAKEHTDKHARKDREVCVKKDRFEKVDKYADHDRHKETDASEKHRRKERSNSMDKHSRRLSEVRKTDTNLEHSSRNEGSRVKRSSSRAREDVDSISLKRPKEEKTINKKNNNILDGKRSTESKRHESHLTNGKEDHRKRKDENGLRYDKIIPESSLEDKSRKHKSRKNERLSPEFPSIKTHQSHDSVSNSAHKRSADSSDGGNQKKKLCHERNYSIDSSLDVADLLKPRSHCVKSENTSENAVKSKRVKNHHKPNHQRNALDVLNDVADEIMSTSNRVKCEFESLNGSFEFELKNNRNSPLEAKDKKIDLKNLKEEIANEVKLVLKPFYSVGLLEKDDYKDIMRRAVPKIFMNCKNCVNPEKIKKLVLTYISMIKTKS